MNKYTNCIKIALFIIFSVVGAITLGTHLGMMVAGSNDRKHMKENIEKIEHTIKEIEKMTGRKA